MLAADPIFPITAVKQSAHKARDVYQMFAAASQLETDFFEGRHRIHGKRAYDFLMQKLGEDDKSKYTTR